MRAGRGHADEQTGSGAARRRLGGAAAVLVAAGALGACSAGEDGAASPSGEPAPAASSAPTGAPDATAADSTATDPAGGTAGSPPSPTALPVIASRKAQDTDEGTELAIELNSVQAAGKLMTVTWSVRNASAEDWKVGFYFWQGFYQKGPLDPLRSEAAGVADGIYVLDKTSARRYLPARDKEGNCVCTGTGTLTVGPGASTPLQAVFQAPPAEVTTVDVVIPHAGTFTAVPVTRT